MTIEKIGHRPTAAHYFYEIHHSCPYFQIHQENLLIKEHFHFLLLFQHQHSESLGDLFHVLILWKIVFCSFCWNSHQWVIFWENSFVGWDQVGGIPAILREYPVFDISSPLICCCIIPIIQMEYTLLVYHGCSVLSTGATNIWRILSKRVLVRAIILAKQIWEKFAKLPEQCSVTCSQFLAAIIPRNCTSIFKVIQPFIHSPTWHYSDSRSPTVTRQYVQQMEQINNGTSLLELKLKVLRNIGQKVRVVIFAILRKTFHLNAVQITLNIAHDNGSRFK